MRRAAGWIAGLWLLSGAGAPIPAATTSQTDREIRAGLMARKFKARVNLYEAQVDEAGRIETDASDGDAIRVGMPVLIKGIRIGRDTIRILMKNPEKGDKVWVDFVFSQELSPGFDREKEAFEKMLGAVFEETQAGLAKQDGN